MNRGEVWRLSPGTKPTGAGEGRLVVILSSDALAVLPLRVVVPLLAWREDFAAAPWMVRLPPVLHSGLNEAMAADVLQVRSVSTVRLHTRLGSLPQRLTDQIAAALGEVLR